jgi:ATP-dependent DNA helicase RecG
MMILKKLLSQPESEKLEFKEAKRGHNDETTLKYLCALANEGGGKLVLGVTDKHPRTVVGTSYCSDPEKENALKLEVRQQLELGLTWDEHDDNGKRVLMLTIESRPQGKPLCYKKVFWKRSGSSLVAMSFTELQEIAKEGKDYSAEPLQDLSIKEHLDKEAIHALRKLYQTKKKKRLSQDDFQFLKDLGLITSKSEITVACVLLLGTPAAQREYLKQADTNIRYMYYKHQDAIRTSDSELYEGAFILSLEKIWQKIEGRNRKHLFQNGLFMDEIALFDEECIREGLLNAVSHRDYQINQPIWVKLWDAKIAIESPGDFPLGVSPSNIIDARSPRNKLLVDVLLKCGWVESAGQGVDTLYTRMIEQGKLLPLFESISNSDHYTSVRLTLDSTVLDESMMSWIAEIIEQNGYISPKELVCVFYIKKQGCIPKDLRKKLDAHIKELLSKNLIERTGRGRFVLSQSAYASQNEYLKHKALPKQDQKDKLLIAIQKGGKQGTSLENLKLTQGVKPENVKNLLQELKKEGSITPSGKGVGARWFILAQDDS